MNGKTSSRGILAIRGKCIGDISKIRAGNDLTEASNGYRASRFA